ncbi:hypothetical protein DFH08DRAFT_878719 [Mycena albidolilacea]|uniref:Uncharacterized protein n=1 Tax=Mycena albidolilacea TaxID=1033008 RepID=A0AAD6ZS35_9AGAR|nr:hypothetical protein DFH08DRAFT_878719 [Mycena albidolilacea]
MASIDEIHSDPSLLKQAEWLKNALHAVLTSKLVVLEEEKANHLQKCQPLVTKTERDPAVKHTSPEETSENDGFATRPLEILPKFVQPLSGNHALNPGYTIPPYFWGESFSKAQLATFPTHPGYVEERSLIGDGSFPFLQNLIEEALETVTRVFESIDACAVDEAPQKTTATTACLRLSPDLLAWRTSQLAAGRVLPAKGHGLRRAPATVIDLLGVSSWPAPLLTNNVLFGTCWSNFLLGAYDPRTLYSNCCCDTAFYYEHGYDRAFPQFEGLLRAAGADAHSRATWGGAARREGVQLGFAYIRAKVALEEAAKARVGGRTARFDRRTAQVVCVAECSMMGLAVETIWRGFDPAAVHADMVFSSPATDVVDVGSDLTNSEVCNSFLNTADLGGAEGGIVTEEALRRVYDGFAHMGARTLTERWAEPTALMNAQLYVWHILNDRHMFLRRAVLGFSKVRIQTQRYQGQADFEEAFDEDFHTTGFSRPLKHGCDGGDPCDAIARCFANSSAAEQLAELWSCLVSRPLEYISAGVVDSTQEEELCLRLSEALAKAYNHGLVLEMAWLTAHASHHAWQVNYLMEAAMWGSLLDDGALNGKLDRFEG